MNNESCATCRFWHSSDGFRSQRKPCRRHSPSFAVSSQPVSAEFVGYWPTTEHDDWCGEYSAAHPKDNRDA